MNKFRLRTSLISKPGQRDNLFKVLFEASKLIENFSGCKIFDVTFSIEEPNLVFIYEEWTDESTYRSSLCIGITKELILRAKPMISGMVRTRALTVH
ncbi:antibiotic biosynthesis monooxygenase [Neobacillus pocheonensis]|uniref:putative quinol monooxygenase n=1 Tax=Neobacillus pocheonensis TaxID=363869 RepID=UPI003D26C7E7